MNLKFWKKSQFNINDLNDPNFIKYLAWKSYDEINNPGANKYLKSVFQFNVHNGIGLLIDDDFTSYIENGYAGNDDVYSIINRIIRMSTQARLALWTTDEKGKWKEVTDHELCAFLRRVNPVMKTSEFQAGHLIYKLSIGNVYWYKPTLEAGVNKGKTKEFYLLPSNNVIINGGANWMNPVGGYSLETNPRVLFTPEEVYHAKFFNPLFGETGSLYGMSPLKAAARTLSKQNQALLNEQKQFENQGPPYILTRDMGKNGLVSVPLTIEQRKELEDQFKDYSKKYKNGLPIVLQDAFKAISLGISPSDLKLIESTKEGRIRLCAIYGFPAVLVGDTSASTYNNLIEAKTDAWSNCIKPNLDDLAGDLTSFLIDPVEQYKGLFFAYDYSAVQELQKDIAKQVTWMKQAYWTPNEIREATGVPPVNDEAMNEVWVGLGEQPLSQATADIMTEPVVKNYGDYGKKK